MENEECKIDSIAQSWSVISGAGEETKQIQAMESLEKLEEERRRAGDLRSKEKGVANNEMCTFLIMNISSLQLIPVNVIAYRSQYGSVDPASIIGVGLAATSISTLVAVVYCKLCNHTL